MKMSIHSVCGNSPVLRILCKGHRLKSSFSLNKNLLCCRKVLQGFSEPASRIIYAHSSAQSYSCEIHEVEKEQSSLCLRENFLKENFNIVDSRYFKLVTIPSECNSLEELLWTEEFKKILSRSPFSYDVDVIESSNNFTNTSAFPSSACEEILCTYDSSSLSNHPVNGYETVFMSTSEVKDNIKGKASEEQLLHVIDRLTDSLIHFFEKSQDYTIYHKNIVFQNNIKGVTIKGLNAYIQSMYLMKLYGFLHFAKVKVEILKVTYHVEDGSIKVRWRVNGLPRHKLLIMLWRNRNLDWQSITKDDTEWLDGFSIFSVGEDGLIYKHICDKMIPDDEQLLAKKVDLKTKVLGLLGLAPRGSAALHALIPCCRNQDLVSCKKLS